MVPTTVPSSSSNIPNIYIDSSNLMYFNGTSWVPMITQITAVNEIHRCYFIRSKLDNLKLTHPFNRSYNYPLVTKKIYDSNFNITETSSINVEFKDTRFPLTCIFNIPGVYFNTLKIKTSTPTKSPVLSDFKIPSDLTELLSIYDGLNLTENHTNKIMTETPGIDLLKMSHIRPKPINNEINLLAVRVVFSTKEFPKKIRVITYYVDNEPGLYHVSKDISINITENFVSVNKSDSIHQIFIRSTNYFKS